MNTVMTVLSYVFAIMLIIGTFAAIIILLIAVFRSIRHFHQHMVKRDAIMLALAKAQIDQLQIQSAMMGRYEKNLAAWYNAQTGEVWKVDSDLKVRSASNRSRIEELAQQIEEEQKRLRP